MVFTKYQNEQSFYCPYGEIDLDMEYNCSVRPAGEEDNDDGVCTDFEQPVYQTFILFMGEFLCFFVFYIMLFFQKRNALKTGDHVVESKLSGWKRLIFLVPPL